MKMSAQRWKFYIAAACTLIAILAPLAVRADGGPQHQAERTRPIELGTSGSNIDDIQAFCCGGTLGTLVKNPFGDLFILSNNHVLGLVNQATVGHPVIQPGLIDQNCFQDIGDTVATFSDLVEIKFKKGRGGVDP